jgi:putative nucleotidyltransferase with HDIG domain
MITADAAKEKKMKLIVGKIRNLPTPSPVFAEITKMISDPNVATSAIADVISNDPALTAKVLKLTNSSFYGLPRTIANVKQSIVFLGLEVVKSLVVSASVFDMFNKKYDLDAVYLEYFWKHSLSAAFMARILSRAQKSQNDIDVEMSFSCGLLHDIGKLIIISQFPEERGSINVMLIQEPEKSQLDAEEQVLGFSHTDIGGYLCSKWNLPESFCDSIRNHHNMELISVDSNAALLHLSNYLAHRLDSVYSGYPPDASPFYDNVWQILGLSPDQEMQFVEMLHQDYAKAETFLNMARGQE